MKSGVKLRCVQSIADYFSRLVRRQNASKNITQLRKNCNGTQMPVAMICGLLILSSTPSRVIAQTSIIVSTPAVSSTSFTLNGASYSGSQNYYSIAGGVNNSGTIQNLQAPYSLSLYQFYANSQTTNPPNGNVQNPPAYFQTGLTWAISGNGVFAGNQPTIQLLSTGASTVAYNYNASDNTYGNGYFGNYGSNLVLNATNQAASVSLSPSISIASAYTVTSIGGSGSSAFIKGPNWNINMPTYSTFGAAGGDVNFNLSNTTGSATPLFVSVSGTSPTGSTLPWLIQTGGIVASSVGGAGSAYSFNNGHTITQIPGQAGNGGNVNVSVGSGIEIALGTAQSPLVTSITSPVAGIVATSIGGAAGICCSNNGPVTLASTGPWPSVLQFPYNANAGSVGVDFSGSIVGTSPYLYGIVAASVGASSQVPPTETSTIWQQSGPSGTGGPVSVALTGGQINLSGSNSVGIFAGSLAGQVILPPQIEAVGSISAAGNVQVTLDSASNVLVGTNSPVPSGQLSAGVIAVSSTGWLFQPVGPAVTGSVAAGNGGNISIANGGTIAAYGGSAFGIIGLSLGNGGVLSNAPASFSGVQYANTPNVAVYSNTSGAVNISNSGTVLAQGNTSIGILAVSNGSGGLINNIPNAVYSSSTLNAQKIAIGTPSAGLVVGSASSPFAAPGGDITITNSGTVQSTANAVAIGVLAQSVGGGGAAATQGAPFYIGDSAGSSGGNGGSISLTNSGTISTSGIGSIGFLGQSIGGGGGNGANSSGLFVAVGGQGGAGGAGGNIAANFQPGSQFLTSGDFSSGLVLQTIGGGGGNGGYGRAHGTFISIGIGGAGGSGGAGGNINVSSASSLISNSATYGDQSHGLLLQSIGGGGGLGGHAYSFSANGVFAGAVAVGGSGGTAGAGGNIAVSGLNGTISTAGTDSMGLFLQSIGGGGGYGGGAISKAYAFGAVPEVPTISLSAAVGGSAAAGADGGGINASIGTNISTFGTGSHAIFAQSIGGGGGGGADSAAGANTINTSDMTFVGSIGIGGVGGGGGAGGSINLNTYNNTISTLGHNASAILGQSIGGGGGYGAAGNATQSDISTGEKQVGLTFSLGGTGGSGGAGSVVTIANNSNSISTVGTQSPGIIGQSISGGGGIGGNAGAQGFRGNHNVGITVGGNAGGGQPGGSVSVTNNGAITTGMQLDLASRNVNSMSLSRPIAIGGDSHGIIAQSIGGGGGIGGNADPSAALIGSVQSLINKGAKDYFIARGVYNFFQGGEKETEVDYNAKIAVGGRGGAGGAGGSVTVSNNGPITTFGHRSYGIFAQSVGGGGGIGGSSTASSAFVSGEVNYSPLSGVDLGLGINVGGQGGNGGNGGAVNLNLTGLASKGAAPQITTTGYASHGVLAQSIGGGGGVAHDGSVFDASASVGLTKQIAVNPSITLGSLSTGAGMQGQGGSISLGTTAITAEGIPTQPPQTIASGTIVTMGDAASGIVLQSIGGGGGLVTFGCTNSGNGAPPIDQTATATNYTASACLHNSSSTTVPGTTDDSLTPSAFQGAGAAQKFSAVIQSSFGTGSNSQGGAINVFSENTIITQGNRSIGLIAQSIGGGGGYVSAPAQSFSSATLPSTGNNQSPGGPININFASWENAGIFTSGNGAWGILAQSIGGGGGFIGDPTFSLNSVPVANNPAAAQSTGPANGGNVSINVGQAGNRTSVNIVTNGTNAHGIVAQSVGGGGGIANTGTPVIGATATTNPANYGSGGTISVNVASNSSVTTYGRDSIGIFAQSTGNTPSSGAIAINIDGAVNAYGHYNSTILPTVGSPTGIMVSGGSTQVSNPNTITIGSSGKVSVGNADVGIGIVTNYGYTNVVNHGSLEGSVMLGSTPGEMTNSVTGRFYSGANVVVSNNSLNNYGLYSIGSLKTVSRTDLTGRFVQYDSGSLAVSIDSLRPIKNDFLQINGNAIVDGVVRPLARTLLPGPVPFLTATNLVSSASVRDTHVFDWSLAQSNNTLIMTPDENFKPAGYHLSVNQSSLADYFKRSWKNSDPASGKNSDQALAPIYGYLHEIPSGDHATYQFVLNQLSGQVLNSQAIQMKTGFANALSYSMACPLLDSQTSELRQTDCSWGTVSGSLTNQASNDSNSGYQAVTGTLRFGAQKSITDDMTAGFAVGYATNKLTSSGLSSNGNMLDVSISASKAINQWSFGGSLFYAQGWFNNSRTPQLFGQGIADSLASAYASNSGMFALGGRIRSAYSFQLTNVYIKPYIDLDVVYAKQPGYSETSGTSALSVGSSQQINFIATPMLELGTSWVAADSFSVKGYVSFGASFLPNNRISTQMTFLNASASNGTFNVVTNGPNALGVFKAGLQAYETEKFEIRAEYGMQASQGYLNQSVGANLIYRF